MVEALRVRQGVEPAVVVVAAQVIDLAQVAEGGGGRGVGKGRAELVEREWARTGEGLGEHLGSALGHAPMVWQMSVILYQNSPSQPSAVGRKGQNQAAGLPFGRTG